MSVRTPASAEHAILFGPFRLLAGQRLLLEGDKEVRLGGRALDILFVERGAEGLSEFELSDEAPPDRRRNLAESSMGFRSRSSLPPPVPMRLGFGVGTISSRLSCGRAMLRKLTDLAPSQQSSASAIMH